MTHIKRKIKVDIPEPNVAELLIEYQGNPFYSIDEVRAQIKERIEKRKKGKMNERSNNRKGCKQKSI